MRQLVCTLLMSVAALTQLPFLDACENWLESRRGYISAKTFHEYSLNIKTLSAFFGELRLGEIDGDLVRAYQRMRRSTPGPRGQPAGPGAINHETGLLCQIKKRVGVPLVDYQPLPLPRDKPGRVISDDERARLLRIASSNQNWEAAYLFAVISVNSSAGPKEVASLRLKDIDWEREQFNVPGQGAKNKFRVRPIPMNADALAGMRQAVERAKRLGSTEPHHHVFPFRIHRSKHDPERYQTTFKTAWKKATAAALLGNLKMYDLRRTAITNMLENPEISDETIEEIAGHVPGSVTKKKYSYIRQEARRRAVDALASHKPPAKKPAKSEKSTGSPEIPPQISELAAALFKLLKTP